MQFDEKPLEGVMRPWEFKVVDRLRACEDPEYAARLEKGEDDGRDKS